MTFIRLLMVASLLMLSFCSEASDVYIETHHEEGQGILHAVGQECLVYTPAHVVARSSDFLISTKLDKRIKAELITTYPQDIALLKLPPASVSACKESSWKDQGERVDTILEVVRKATLNIRLNNGRLVSYDVEIVDKDLHSTFSVRMQHPTKKITKGMSGGIITVSDYPIGMLTSVQDDLGKVVRMDTIADVSRSVVRTFASEKEQLALQIGTQKPLKNLAPSTEIPPVLPSKTGSLSQEAKQTFKGKIAKGASETFSILSRGNTAYRLHIKKQTDATSITVEYQNPDKKRLAADAFSTEKDAIWEFGTIEQGEHFLVIKGRKGAGSYELELEEIATPEQQISDSNVIGHGDVVRGNIAPGTFAVYKILSRGNTAYRLHIKKQSDGASIALEYQNPGKKRLALDTFSTEKNALWEFGTIDQGEHFLIIQGRKGSGSYELELEVIATPEQQISDSNVIGHGDVARGKIAPGTFAVYKIRSRGNTSYRLHIKKQSDGAMIALEYQNPANKRLSADVFNTEKENQWGFGTTESGDHFLVVSGRKGSGDYELALEVLQQ